MDVLRLSHENFSLRPWLEENDRWDNLVVELGKIEGMFRVRIERQSLGIGNKEEGLDCRLINLTTC